MSTTVRRTPTSRPSTTAQTSPATTSSSTQAPGARAQEPAAAEPRSSAWSAFRGQQRDALPTSSDPARRGTHRAQLAAPSVKVALESPIQGVRLDAVGDRWRLRVDGSAPLDAKATLSFDGHKVVLTRDQEWDGFIVPVEKAAQWPRSGPLPFELLGVRMPAGYSLMWEGTSTDARRSDSTFRIVKDAG